MRFAHIRTVASFFVALVAVACSGQTQEPPPPEAAVGFVVETAPPEPGSARAQTLAALDHAENFRLYSLQPFVPPVPPSPGESDENIGENMQAAWDAWGKECDRGGCLQRNRILGVTDVAARTKEDILKNVLRNALGRVPNYGLACAAQYRHAIGFVSAGKEYHVLLCYECGQIAVAVGGKEGHQEQAYELAGEPELDAMLTSAGIWLADKPD